MGARILAAVIALVLLAPDFSAAQVSRGGSSRGSQPQPMPPPPPPGSGPLPRDLVPPAPPSALDSRDVFRAGPRTYAPQFDRVPRRGRPLPGVGFGYPYIADPLGYVTEPYDSSLKVERYSRQGREGLGFLRLDVEPDAAQVYVDGYYAGQVNDFRRGGRALEPGPHRIEIRADGFDAHTFDIRIPRDEMVSYRQSLVRSTPRAEMRVAAALPKTFYVIPGCYAGDIRPRSDQLPSGCRIARLREVPPVKGPAARR
jgi:hypothetical protein